MAELLVVEVVYATAERQELRRLEMHPGDTLQQAVRASGLLEQYPEIDAATAGIFGKRADPDTLLRDHDRVEIYRPLRIDPRESRRRRARAHK